jgi:hypothetical protein
VDHSRFPPRGGAVIVLHGRRFVHGFLFGTLAGLVVLNAAFALTWASAHLGHGGVSDTGAFRLSHHPSLGRPVHLDIREGRIGAFLALCGFTAAAANLVRGRRGEGAERVPCP